MSKIAVLIADDHSLLRQGIASILDGEDDIEVVGQARDGVEAVESFLALRPDVTLMDIHMPVIDGIEALISIREISPDARVIMMTACRSGAPVHRALKAGACGYLLKSMMQKDLRSAIRLVHAGGKYVPTHLVADADSAPSDDPLSESEISVLKHVAVGMSNKQIAAVLEIPEETVKSRMKSILAKLEANDRTHAVMLAVKRGLIDLF